MRVHETPIVRFSTGNFPSCDWCCVGNFCCTKGGKFKRRTFTFGFGTGSERTEVRLKEDIDTVLCWRKESEAGKQESWHEIDLGDVKAIEAKGMSVHTAHYVCAVLSRDLQHIR